MFTVKSKEDFIADIKLLDQRLQNIRLTSIEVDRKDYSVTYNFICDVAVDEGLKKAIKDEADKITDKIFDVVRVNITKIVSNPELINMEIYKYLSSNFPSISMFLKQTDIYSENTGANVKYTLRLIADGIEYMKRNNGIEKLNEYLGKKFCSDFIGDLEEKEIEDSVDLSQEEVYASQIKRVQMRTITVSDMVVIDDYSMPQTALYIEDFTNGNAVITGKVVDIVERETKNGKPYFRFFLDDQTGRTSGLYFSKKATYKKIKDITVGEAIIARANMGEYNGSPSITLEKINRCTFPSDFVKQPKFKNSAPKNYSLIFPEKATTMSVKSVFDDTSIPQKLRDSTFVVFDLETTGIEVANHGITEIGAVKIVNGKIEEQFTTLIKPDYPISKEITEITGITPEMVEKSPKISAVLPDFMKFILGATLVGHNVDFDLKFIKKFANAEEYEVNNKVEDTMMMARRLTPHLKKYDLKTVADNFGIVFHHHRALSDAYATAEAFIELSRLEK